MGRIRFKWKCIFLSCLVLLNVFTKSLPILELKTSSLTTTDTVFKHTEVPRVTETTEDFTIENSVNQFKIENDTDTTVAVNLTRSSLFRNNIRPGQTVNQYAIEITQDGNMFRGRAVIDIEVTQATREAPLVLYAEGLNINTVMTGVFSEANIRPAGFELEDSVLEIFPPTEALTYVVVIEYTGRFANGGRGLHRGEFNEGQGTYVAMNLHPTHARHVFPCMDEPTEVTRIRFTFNGFDYTHLISNSIFEDNSVNQFRSLQGPPHLWGMIAHNLNSLILPTTNVVLYGRVSGQHDQASIAINFFFNNMVEWTNKPYFDIIFNQDGRLNIVALPDVSTDWHALSTIGIWEPYVLMENVNSVAQRKDAFFEMAKAIAKQWFGYVIYPENWRDEWVVSGLASYAAYEMLRLFQNNLSGDVTLLDINTIFVSDVIQESLLRDAYVGSQVLQPEGGLFQEDEIRDHVHGLLKYKAPAILRMMRIVLGNPDQDFIQSTAQALVNGRALQTVNSHNFIDALNSAWDTSGNKIVDNIVEYMEPWLTTTGYPVLHISTRQGGVMIMQERFSFVEQDHQSYLIPITYTTSINPDFSNIQPVLMSDASTSINFALGEEDWVLFNIQGQGYYRVNYEPDLWERILEALEDPDRRGEIHPLNRATLVDDALNLARTGRLDYEIAFRVVLSMEFETEYAVWKAFIRNMDFLKKRLEAMVNEEEDLDPDIYLRMVRRTVVGVENHLGFYPDVSLSEPAMDTLTRGLVMDHACRAGYNPCIAAAIDWFYDPNANEPVVNPNIPHEIRPAVYCTMVREGDEDVIEALYARLEIEPTLYERVVILESLACSQDEGFIRMLLEETIATNSPYSVEERNKIFAAVARASFSNAFIAVNFISMRTLEVRNNYGGAEKLEEIIHMLAECMANFFLATEFRIWVTSQNNNLDDSQGSAERALAQVNQNLEWDNAHLQYVYEWIDENDASTMVLSIVALLVSIMIALLNH